MPIDYWILIIMLVPLKVGHDKLIHYFFQINDLLKRHRGVNFLHQLNVNHVTIELHLEACAVIIWTVGYESHSDLLILKIQLHRIVSHL